MCVPRSIQSTTVTLSASEERQVDVAAPTGQAVIAGGWEAANDSLHVFASRPVVSPSEVWRFYLKNAGSGNASITLYAVCTVVA